MLPSVLASQLRQMLSDYITTNFPMSNSFFKDTLPSLLSPDSVSPIFHDPYISVRLPFRISEEEENLFSAFLLNFKPYVHQRQAFLRLNGDGAKSTLIATGTGSGKTECFLYPILEYSCNNHSEGIKALLIYPMNALANDQAKRIAKLIHENPNLKNNVTAGLYTGQKDNIHNSMGEDHIISDRAVLRNRPPDILLTNYKMLDYLLLRPVDSSLWEKNDAETLKYIVVDELHTFDGAKGTDLACLIRRLKSRLATPKNYLCCVGTSATMGAKETSASILNFAEKIFGESFPEDSLITEDRLTASQFVSGWDILRSNVPSRAQMDNLKIFSQKDDPDSYLTLAAQSWLGANIPKTRISDPDICLSLSDKLRHHSFFHHLLRFAEDRPFQAKEALKELQNYFPDLGNDGQSQAALYAFLDLISHARIGTIDSPRPFLTVNVQLWLRELHRLVAKVGHKNEIVYSLAHDLNETQGPTFLPVINCRDCGETGWVSSINSKRCVSISDYSNFYKKFFSLDSEIKMLFPYEGVSSEIDDNETGDNNNDDLDGTKKKDHKLSGKASLGHSTPHLGQASKFSYGLLCPHCMTLKAPLAQISAEEAQNPCSECGTKGLIPVRIPDLSPAKKKSFHRIQYVCPFCGSTTGVTLMGWRSTTAISTCLSQIFASKFNNDKKTLAFSDNVQDAAYLAGFFNNRAWRFGIRSAIQQYARAVGTKNFQTFSEEFTEHWKNKWSMEQLVSLFTPPNLSYRREYEEMKENRSFPDTEQNQSFLALLSKRLKYEIMLEYGLYSRRGGRSLVGTGCSLLAYPPHLIQKTADIAFEKALNELGISKNDNAGLTFQRMTLGILDIMRANGAFYDRTFEKFAYKGGNTYFLTKKFFHWIPGVQPGRNTPRFPYIPSSSFNTTNAFDLFRSTKYTTWIRACSNQLLLNSDILGEIVKRILKELEQSGLIVTLLERNNVWGLNKENLTLTTEVVTLECDSCGTHLNAAKINSELWDGAPCLRNNCRGHYKLMKNPNISYYARLYSEGDIVRLNAHEHTGILSQVQRDTLEKSFKVPSDEQQPWDTNILTCTPTMEMGIDIGDLSTVILCNVPPAESQFLQRSGRAGRKDGNSLVVTVANAKPHDLYFFEQPEDMIKGTIKVPTVFIQAPAVLERQFFAFIMDNWVRKGDNGRPIQHRAIPENINKCLNNLEKKDTNIYPFNFLNYTDKNLSNLIDNFLEMFAGELEEESINALEIYAKGDGKNEKPVFIKLLNAFRMQKKEIESLNQNIRNIKDKINDIRNNKPNDPTFDDEIKELEFEKRPISEIIKQIRHKDIFNFLSDEGLLPNYTFPEKGIKLKAVLRRTEDKRPRLKEKIPIYEYSRSASTAINELAPSNVFYVDGRKLTIDQIDLATAKIERWRLCPNCSHAQQEIQSEMSDNCPRCGHDGWGDIGQLREMLKVRMVYSNSDYEESLIGDESEDRVTKYYSRQMLVDTDEKDIVKAYSMINDDFPFGYDFAKKVTMREINFGAANSGNSLTVAGHDQRREGFQICKHCGKVRPLNQDNQLSQTGSSHSLSCPHYRKREEDSNIENDEIFAKCLFLYREFQTEALRLLVPATTVDSTSVRVESFTAAIMLGLREHFGNVEHLQTCITEVPVPDADYKKQYLVVYDSVPGGTGYLKQLAADKKDLSIIFEKALNVIESCNCRFDENKDGCYRCLFAYRQSRKIGQISRKTAIKLLQSILKGRNNLDAVQTLDDIQVNALFESELERRFVEALGNLKGENGDFIVEQDFVQQKEGYTIRIGNKIWELEPQVPFLSGTSAASRADFVLWPGKGCSESHKPVAVFTDGFKYHKDSVDSDTLKREAIRRIAKSPDDSNFRLWILSWNDVETIFNKKIDYHTQTLFHNNMPAGPEIYNSIVKSNSINGKSINASLITPEKTTTMELLGKYLELDDADLIFSLHARAYAFSLLEKDKFKNEEYFEPWSKKMKNFTDSMDFSDGDFGIDDTFFGKWSPASEFNHLNIYSGIKNSVWKKNKSDSSFLVFSCLDDRESKEAEGDIVQRSHNYEPEWNGFWHFFNVMQFFPGFYAVSQEGLDDSIYADLQTIVTGYAPTEIETTPDITGTWAEIFPLLLGPESKKAAQEIKSLGIPAPDEIGFELTNSNGEVIAEAEMAWIEMKTVFLIPEQMSFAQIFTNNDWIVLTSESPITLNSFQGRIL